MVLVMVLAVGRAIKLQPRLDTQPQFNIWLLQVVAEADQDSAEAVVLVVI
jgi:hypothetical protein